MTRANRATAPGRSSTSTPRPRPQIFATLVRRQLRTGGSLLHEKYPNEVLIEVLEELFGDTPLAAALSPAMVTAYDTEKRRPLMFKSEKAKREPEWNLPMCAYAEALKRIARKDLSMVSLGIGAPTRPLPYEEVREWGLVHWARPLLDLTFDGTNHAVNHPLEHLLRPHAYYRLRA